MKLDRFLLITVGALLAIIVILLAMGGAAFLCLFATHGPMINEGPLLEKSYGFNGTLSGFDRVDLRVGDINGAITVREGEGDAFDIKVDTTGTAADHDRYKVEFTQPEAAGVKTLDLEVKDTWEPRVYNSRYVADIVVTVPKGKQYDVKAATVNGRVELGNLSCGQVTAATVNGELASGASAVNATYATVNGGIDVRTDAVKGKIFANSVNGGIAICVPQGSALSLNAHVVNGRISNALPIVVDEKSRLGLVGKTANYTEGLYVEATTVNGGIDIETH
jgi:DUF4097 and DUF4098 domain-containing protein YvlB